MKKLSHFQKQLLFSYFGDKHNINLSKDDFKHIDDVICSQNSGNAIVSGAFYCQRSIEDEDKCEEQCEHCRGYYAPLQK